MITALSQDGLIIEVKKLLQKKLMFAIIFVIIYNSWQLIHMLPEIITKLEKRRDTFVVSKNVFEETVHQLCI